MVFARAVASTLLACHLMLNAASSSAPRLYVCQSGQCVLNSRGLPLSECKAACSPPPDANYTCQGNQCVVSTRGLPKAECTQVCVGPPPSPRKTILEIAVATPYLSTLVRALSVGGLVGTLSHKGPFTVFAPTNAAFAALPADTVAKLFLPENKAQLDDLVTYHVVAGDIFAKDLKDQETVKTLEGKELIVRVDGGDVFINSAKVTTANVNASNGVVHIIDRVLVPPGPSPGPSPTGCTKAGCFFSFTNRPGVFGGRCGEVDAAPRMPDDIWTDKTAVAEYVRATEEAYANNYFSTGSLKQQPCDHNPAQWVRNGSQQINWLGTEGQGTEIGFDNFCVRRCSCCPPGAPSNPERCPRTCTDMPDKPPYYCSLCGPTLNAPISVYFYYPIRAP